ncbi:unnamed protein product [Linum tenue]|nr:unnamed protein product [Linum tenue]
MVSSLAHGKFPDMTIMKGPDCMGKSDREQVLQPQRGAPRGYVGGSDKVRIQKQEQRPIVHAQHAESQPRFPDRRRGLLRRPGRVRLLELSLDG